MLEGRRLRPDRAGVDPSALPWEAASDADEEEILDPAVISASLANARTPADAGRMDDIGALIGKLSSA